MLKNNPIRILHIITEANMGGLENFIMNLYRNIDKEKVQFDFIEQTNNKCYFDDEIERLGGKIYRSPNYTFKNHFTYCKWYKEFFKMHTEYKIIHDHAYNTSYIHTKIANKFKIKTIVHSHSTANDKNLLGFIKTAYAKMNRFTAKFKFACSINAGKWLFGKKITTDNAFKIIKNAIDVDKFAFSNEKRNALRLSLNISNDDFVIGHIGRFNEVKNHKFLIQIFNEVQKRKPDSKLLIVGDGGLRPDIEKQIKDLELQNKVILTGNRNDVADLLQAMDVFVFPSLYEGLPVTLIETQASGLDCVVADNITKEIVLSEEMKFVSLAKEPTYWVDIIMNIDLNNDRQKNIDKIKEAGFDVDVNTKWLEGFYINEYNK